MKIFEKLSSTPHVCQRVRVLHPIADSECYQVNELCVQCQMFRGAFRGSAVRVLSARLGCIQFEMCAIAPFATRKNRPNEHGSLRLVSSAVDKEERHSSKRNVNTTFGNQATGERSIINLQSRCTSWVILDTLSNLQQNKISVRS